MNEMTILGAATILLTVWLFSLRQKGINKQIRTGLSDGFSSQSSRTD